jgi:hypothetical protein
VPAVIAGLLIATRGQGDDLLGHCRILGGIADGLDGQLDRRTECVFADGHHLAVNDGVSGVFVVETLLFRALERADDAIDMSCGNDETIQTDRGFEIKTVRLRTKAALRKET